MLFAVKDIQDIAKKTFSFEDFNEQALNLFHWHYEHNAVYSQFCKLLNIDSKKIFQYADIPFLPIEFFKTKKISAFSPEEAVVVFESSTTTSSIPSCHFIHDGQLYQESILRHFEKCYGHANQYNFLALLPNYLERGNSSLVYMVDFFDEIFKRQATWFLFE